MGGWVGGWVGGGGRTVGQVIEREGFDVTGAHVLQVALGVDVEIVRDGEPEVFLAPAQPVLKDQARDRTALAHAGCIGWVGGWVGGWMED